MVNLILMITRGISLSKSDLIVWAKEIEQVKELEKSKYVRCYLEICKELRKHWVYADELAVRKHDPRKKEFEFQDMDERKIGYAKWLRGVDRKYWQKACDLDQNSIEYKKMLIQALWIFSRFHEWLGKDWAILIGAEEKLMRELNKDGK